MKRIILILLLTIMSLNAGVKCNKYSTAATETGEIVMNKVRNGYGTKKELNDLIKVYTITMNVCIEDGDERTAKLLKRAIKNIEDVIAAL